jgi:hypothetical protein
LNDACQVCLLAEVTVAKQVLKEAETTMEHVDRQKLYTDLQYRFNYVAKFVGFGEEDIKAIKDSANLVAPLVKTIVDAVYVKLFSFDITKDVFAQRNEGFDGTVDSSATLNLNSDQIKFRKDMLTK